MVLMCKKTHPKGKGGRPKTMINRDILQHVLSLNMNNAKIDQVFKVRRNLITQLLKKHQIVKSHEPEDDEIVVKELK